MKMRRYIGRSSAASIARPAIGCEAKLAGRRRVLCLLAAAGTVQCALTAQGATQTSTWEGTLTAGWTNANNWSPTNAYPNNGNGGISDFNVVIPTSSTEPFLDGPVTIDSLTVNSGASILLTPTGNLQVGGTTFANGGTISIDSNSTNSATLTVLNNTAISGTGTILLSPTTTSVVPDIDGQFSQSAGSTIAGSGLIFAMFTNNGTINANVSGFGLGVEEGATNDGLMEATGGGTLTLNGGFVTQSGGTISANGGTVVMTGGCEVNGGTLASSAGGTFQENNASVTLMNVTNNATYDLGNNASLNVNTSLVNNGVINVNGAPGAPSQMSFSGTLSGTGTINLSGGPTGASVFGTLTQNAGHTIAGAFTFEASVSNAGTISANIPGGTMSFGISSVTNSGTLQATGGTVVLNSTIITNTGGTISASAGQVQMEFGSEIQGGTVQTSGTGSFTVVDGYFNGVTIAANSTVGIPSSDSLIVSGVNTNNGNIVVNTDNGFMPAQLVANSVTSILGSGVITFNVPGGGSAISCSSQLTVGCSMTTSGPGTLVFTGGGGVITTGTNIFPVGTTLAINYGGLDVAAGGSVVANGADQIIGGGNSGNGELLVSGTGSFSTNAAINVGYAGGDGLLKIQDTATLSAGVINVGSSAFGQSSTGTVVQSGGQVTASGIVISAGGLSDGSYTLSGGTLQTASVSGGLFNATFEFNGGTIQSTANNANFMIDLSVLEIGSGGATINSNGFNIGIGQGLTAASGSTGGLTKSGAGTLTLSAAPTYTGATAVSGGDLQLVGHTLASTSASIASGAVLEYDESNPTTIGQGPITFTGTGTLRKTGTAGLAFGATGVVNVDFSAGALVDVEQGGLYASSSYGGNWATNLASLNVAAGATFDAVEGGGNSEVQVDALTGAGIVQGGYYLAGPTTLFIGAAGGSGTFSGSLRDDINTQLVLTKLGSGTETLSGTNTFSGGTNVNGGKLIIAAAKALPNAALAIANTASVQLAHGIGPVTISFLGIGSAGSLDITNNHFFIHYGSGGDPIASIRQWIKSGYAGGTWAGAGIMSSMAQQNALSYGIGYADSADPNNPANLASGTIEVKYTLLGDVNLDGAVNGSDFAILATNFNKAVNGWDQGDFNYDGAVNGSDFAELAINFNKGASQADVQALDAFAAANGLSASVPEPACGGLLVMSAGALLGRRVRKNRKPA